MRCDAALRPFTGWSVRPVLVQDPGAAGSLEQIDVVQPALFAVMVALAMRWVVTGIAAGCGDRAFDRGDRRGVCGGGVQRWLRPPLVALRSQAVGAGVSGRGDGLGVVGAEELAAVLEGYPAAAIAAVNGPAFSGGQSVPAEAVAGFVEVCVGRGWSVTSLAVGYALPFAAGGCALRRSWGRWRRLCSAACG